MKLLHLALIALLGLTACDNTNNRSAPPVDSGVVVGTRAADYSSGAHTVMDAMTPFTANNQLNPSGSSDIVVVGGDGHFFRIERFGGNRISRYETDSPDTPTWSYSTEGTLDTNSNPYTLVELNATKAYLLRYGSGKLWIVNPSASNEADFYLGEINLSAYDPDGVPEMATAVIQGDLLYVGLQRLENFAATRSSYVAIIDTTTDTEVDTRSAGSAEPLPGINLGIRNVMELASVAETGDIIALAAGGYDENFAPVLDGGIVRIDPVDYRVVPLVDDGSPNNAPYGQLLQLAVASEQRAYFVASTSFSNASLYRFDPGTGTLANAGMALPEYAERNLGDIAVDASARLWVAQLDANAPGLSLLDSDDNTIAALLDTVLIPTNIDFVQ